MKLEQYGTLSITVGGVTRTLNLEITGVRQELMGQDYVQQIMVESDDVDLGHVLITNYGEALEFSYQNGAKQ